MSRKKQIEEIRKKNGNESFTQKDMIMYIMDKVDCIDEKLAKGAGKIAMNYVRINGITKTLMVGIPLLCATLGWLFIRTTGG